MKVIVDNAEETIEKTVISYRTCTRISVPRRWSNRKVKIILLR